MPSPRRETVIPVQSIRKSRCRSGERRFTREKPPGRSSPSWLCCMRALLAPEVLEERFVVHRLGEQEALAELAAEIAERGDLLGQLDALCDDVEVEAGAERDDRRREA